MVGRTLRVLVADDNERVRRAICRFLKGNSDIEIICEASGGEEAVRLALLHKPDLVLMDISMPDLDGLQATRLIKRDLAATKVLMVSQFISPAAVREATAAGASGYVVKDRVVTDLLPKINELRNEKVLGEE